MRQSLKRTATVLGVSALLVAGTFSIVGSGSPVFGQTAVSTITSSAAAVRTVSVSGDGQVSLRPDTASIRIAVSELASTTRAAQQATNTKTTEVLAILRKSGIKDENIRTSNISFSTEYDWSSSERKVLGQRVRQELEAKVSNLGPSDQNNLSILLDALAGIENIEIYSVSFDLDDQEQAYGNARKLAFEKAREKAAELAGLAEEELGRIVSISEGVPTYSPLPYANVRSEMAMDRAG
ncbi:MAG TPA: SIMPL domain-containing protein [bacterium]|nr:SIMPL domain-containing protein [bacterium]